MRNRKAIFFLILANLLVGLALVYLAYRAQMFPVRGMEARILPFEPQDVSVCDVAIKADGAYAVMHLTRTPQGAWQLEAPFVAKTDAELVWRMLDAFCFARPTDALSATALAEIHSSYADFALNPARYALSFVSRKGVQKRLLLGRETPRGGDVYARLEGEDSVFTLSTNILSVLPATPVDLLPHTLVGLLPQDIDVIEVRVPGEPFVKLMRRTDGTWRLTEPHDALADVVRVTALLERVARARISAYVWPSVTQSKPTPTALGLDAETGTTLTLRTLSGMAEQIVFGPAGGTNLVYALRVRDETIVTVDAALLGSLRLKYATLLDRRLFPYNEADIASITLTYGRMAYVLERNQARQWHLTSPVAAPCDETRVASLVTMLTHLTDTNVVHASSVKAVALGVSCSKTNVPPVFVSIDSFGGDGALLDLHAKTLLSLNPGNVRHLRVTSAAGETAVAFDTGRGAWRLVASSHEGRVHAVASAPKNVDDEAVGKLLEALRKVEAVSVETLSPTAQDRVRYGFDAPAFIISADLADGQSVRKNILLGHAAPGGGRYATVGGSQTVFIVSRATVAALTMPLTK